MRVMRNRYVTIRLSEDVYVWPGHRRDILSKMDELAEIIHSLETGRTERILDRT